MCRCCGFRSTMTTGRMALPPAGFTTSVELPLRDQAAVGLVTRLLAETGPALLLALPALAEIVIETGGVTRVLTAVRAGDLVTITDGDDGHASAARSAGGGWPPTAACSIRPCWRTGRPRNAPAPPGRSAGRYRSTRTARPIALPGDGVSAVVHAPTPTDEPLGLPALLLASFPLSPDRRHVAPGPLTDFLVERAADVYAGMLPGLAAGPGLLDLVPGPVGRGELDARLSRAIASRLPDVAFLPAVRTGGGADPARATRCCWRAAPRRWPTGSRRCCPAWSRGRPGTRRSRCWGCDGCRWPSWPTCSPPSTGSRPGGGGCTRRWRAPRPRSWPSSARCRCRWRTGGWCAARAGCCCRAAASIIRTGWRCSGCGWWPPRRRTRCWLRLGGFEATPRTVLEDAATRAAVAASYDAAVEAGYDDDRPERVADAVLGLVAALNAEPGDYPYLADLALPGDDGDWYPAGELLLPGSPLAEVIAADAPFGTIEQAAVDRYGARALEAAGVLSSFGLLTAEDVELDESAIDLDLDGVDDWAADSARLACGEPRRSRRSRSRSPPSATSTWSTPTAGRGPWNCLPVPRCGRPWSTGPGSGWPTAATRTCRRTRPGGCAGTWCSTATVRATCAPRTPTRCWPDCTTRWAARARWPTR